MAVKTNNPKYGNIFAAVDTFDELRSIPTTTILDGTSAIVNGGQAIGDALGGLFLWHPTATADDNGANILAPSDGGQGRWLASVAAKGDPGGNALAIGLFADAAVLAIPSGTNLVQTAGHGSTGRGAARYVYDPAVDAAYIATHPLTAFLTTNGRGFRLAESSVGISMLGVRGDGTDETARVQAAFNAVVALGITRVGLEGLTIKLAVVSVDGSLNLTIDGQGATVLPAIQTGGRFTFNGAINLTIRGIRFVQTPKFNYTACLTVLGGQRVTIEDNVFSGVGFGVTAGSCEDITFARNRLSEVGLYPRPAAIGLPDGSAFSAGFEIYGGGIRAALCNRVIFKDNVLKNALPAGGHLYDGTGGPGAFSAYLCNDVLFEGGTSDGAPGQGFCATGAWQGTNVVYPGLQGTLDYGLNGRNIRFVNCFARCSNQEGITAFGVGNVTIANCQAEHNRYCSIEAWQCWDVSIENCKSYEPASTINAIHISNGSTISGDGIHVVGVLNAIVQGNLIREAALNAITIWGSYNVIAASNIIRDYAADDSASLHGSAINLNRNLTEPDHVAMSTEVILSNNRFARKNRTNNLAHDIFINDAGALIYTSDNTAVGRAVSYYGHLPNGAPTRSMGQQSLELGNVATPSLRIRDMGSALNVGQSPTTIANLSQNINSSFKDGYLLLVSIGDDSNGDTGLTELVLAMPNGTASVLGSTTHGTYPARTYSISGTSLQCAMATGTYSARVTGLQACNGSKYI